MKERRETAEGNLDGFIERLLISRVAATELLTIQGDA
jgi:hypothetical protein